MSVRRALLALAAVLVPAAAGAYVRTPVDRQNAPDSCVFWQKRQIPWSPAETLGGALPEAQALEAIRASFATWSAESCTDLTFVERPGAEREAGYRSRGANDNAVLFRDRYCDEIVPAGDACLGSNSCANKYDCWDWDPTVIAMTTTTFSPCSGRLVDADIEMNSAGFDFTVGDGPLCSENPRDPDCIGTDLRNTIVHEVGHFIGLDHSPERGSTMFVTALLGETEKRTLADDDIEAICDIYPAGGETWICEPAQPLNRCGEDGSLDGARTAGCSSGAGGLAPLALVPAALWLRRRKSR